MITISRVIICSVLKLFVNQFLFTLCIIFPCYALYIKAFESFNESLIHYITSVYPLNYVTCKVLHTPHGWLHMT